MGVLQWPINGHADIAETRACIYVMAITSRIRLFIKSILFFTRVSYVLLDVHHSHLHCQTLQHIFNTSFVHLCAPFEKDVLL